MGRECPRVELDYRNELLAELVMVTIPVFLGGSEFLARLSVDEALAGFEPKKRMDLVRRLRRALFSEPVSEAIGQIRARQDQEAEAKAKARMKR